MLHFGKCQDLKITKTFFRPFQKESVRNSIDLSHTLSGISIFMTKPFLSFEEPAAFLNALTLLWHENIKLFSHSLSLSLSCSSILHIEFLIYCQRKAFCVWWQALDLTCHRTCNCLPRLYDTVVGSKEAHTTAQCWISTISPHWK